MTTLSILAATAMGCAAGPQPEAVKRVLVIAHRGAHADAPENTLTAIERAIALGCDYVEVDVRQSRDGKLVVLHDSTVDRTTDGVGKVVDLTFEEIRRLAVPFPGDETRPPERVPTFDEALATCQGRIGVLVDNKAGPPHAVLAAIRARNMIPDVVIYDSVDRLREFQRLDPDVWIQPPHPGSIQGITVLLEDLGPQTLDGNAVEWNREEVEAAHRLGARVWVDNLGERDNEAGVHTSVGFGVDAIQTDHPEMTLRVLRELGRHR